MFNYKNLKINLMFEVIFNLFNSKTYKISNNSIHIYNSKNSKINSTNLFFIDLSNIVSQKFNNNNIFYNMYDLKNFKTIDIYFYNKKSINSIYYLNNAVEWYERELVEKSTIYIKNMNDMRNLLYNYNNKIITGILTNKNNYYWTYTNVNKRCVYINNNYRIIL